MGIEFDMRNMIHGGGDIDQEAKHKLEAFVRLIPDDAEAFIVAVRLAQDGAIAIQTYGERSTVQTLISKTQGTLD